MSINVQHFNIDSFMRKYNRSDTQSDLRMRKHLHIEGRETLEYEYCTLYQWILEYIVPWMSDVALCCALGRKLLIENRTHT